MPNRSARQTACDVALHEGDVWCVNGEDAAADVSDFLSGRTAGAIDMWVASRCPYCAVPLRTREFDDTDAEAVRWTWNREYHLRWCVRCAYWELGGGEWSNACMDASRTLLVRSVAARFAPRLPDACASELAQYLRRRPGAWNELPPRRMEVLVAELFRANYRHTEVLHVGRPGDRGVDVLFVDDQHTQWLVQVKRRERSDRAAGFETLQRVLGTLALTGGRYGVIATTADSYSHQARAAANEARTRGFHVELLDRGRLDRMLGPLLPEAPRRTFLSDTDRVPLDADVVAGLVGQAHSVDQLEIPLDLRSGFRDCAERPGGLG